MTESTCRYAGDRNQALVSYLYGDSSDFTRGERADFEAHLALCDACRIELGEFTDLRVALGAWSPPQFRSENSPSRGFETLPQTPPGRGSSWRDIPIWAQTAAALLCLGIGAGIANLDVQYGPTGLHVRTGWSSSPGTPDPGAQTNRVADVSERTTDNVGGAPWRVELTALEERLRADIRQASATSPPEATATELRRVRTLVEESERRQERELALRLAEALRDVGAQRQADLARIDRNIGAMQSNTGREMLRQRSEMLNYVTVRTASQRGQ